MTVAGVGEEALFTDVVGREDVCCVETEVSFWHAENTNVNAHTIINADSFKFFIMKVFLVKK
jgi:hypothetical protein